MAVWRYQLKKEFTITSKHLLGVEFENEWISIYNGIIIVRKNYAWDGASPCYYLPFIGWVGIPEGDLLADGFPRSYYATLVHDALCQYREEIYIPKIATVDLFQEMLLDSGFPKITAFAYAKAVYFFGPKPWLGYKTEVTA